MKQKKYFLVPVLFVSCLAMDLNAQQQMNINQSLSVKQQGIVTISAFTAKGNLAELQKALNEGLDARLTVNEIKEVLVQLYAYTGFPRSLNALNTFLIVLKERKAKGIIDPEGKSASPLTTSKSKLDFGTEMQTKLVGTRVTGEVYQFAPAIDRFLKEHLFGDIFGRDNIDWKTRELATIAALAALGNVENQLRSHFNVGMYNGLTQRDLEDVIGIIELKVDVQSGYAARNVLQGILKSVGPTKKENEKKVDQVMIFPQGEKITNNNFTGTAWLHQMLTADSSNAIQVGNVTFEPGARTNWHLHPSGQILLITGGTGYYQEKGSPKRVIKKGDVINCPSNVQHWHGASKNEPLIQVAITNTQKGAPVWLEKVTDEEYNN